MNFIKSHLIKKIIEIVDEKQDSINFTGQFHLDEIISDGENNIDRVGKQMVYLVKEDPIWSFTRFFHELEGETLLNVFNQIKKNKFYFYKEVNGKLEKLRFKYNIELES